MIVYTCNSIFTRSTHTPSLSHTHTLSFSLSLSHTHTHTHTHTQTHRYFDEGDISAARGPRCFRCGGVGHMIKDCTSDGSEKPCFLCAHTGHLPADCPNSMCVFEGVFEGVFVCLFVCTCLQIALVVCESEGVFVCLYGYVRVCNAGRAHVCVCVCQWVCGGQCVDAHSHIQRVIHACCLLPLFISSPLYPLLHTLSFIFSPLSSLLHILSSTPPFTLPHPHPPPRTALCFRCGCPGHKSTSCPNPERAAALGACLRCGSRYCKASNAPDFVRYVCVVVCEECLLCVVVCGECVLCV